MMGIRSKFTDWRCRRAQEYLARHGYAAAKHSPQDQWFTVNEQINHLIGRASPRLRSRVRDLVRNFPLFSRGLNAYTACMVGRGARFQSLAVHPDGTPAPEIRAKIEQRFRAWMECDADVSGNLHLYEMQQLLCRQLLEGGEGLFAFQYEPRNRINPLSLMAIDADRLTDYGAAPLTADAELFAGVEFDPRTGRKLAYHVTDGWYQSEVRRIAADDMVHVYQHLRPGQLRGVTPLASAILIARAMAEYTQNELTSSRMAAQYMAMVTTESPRDFQASRGIVGSSAASGAQRPDIDYLENAIIEYLRPGEKIEFAQTASRPGDSFDRFCRFATRMIAVTIDVPYEMLSGDYQNINYSTSKASRGDSRLLLQPHRLMMDIHFSRRLFRRWMDTEALTQDYMPGYWKDPEAYCRCLWIPAAMPSVEPQKDNRADIDAIAAGLKSPQEAILERGNDPEEVLDQLAEWQRMARERGVTFGEVSTSLSGAPSALEDQPVKPGYETEEENEQ